jgi:hypothetical protein
MEGGFVKVGGRRKKVSKVSGDQATRRPPGMV